MKIYKPVFLDCNERRTPCRNWLIQAINPEEGLRIAQAYYDKVDPMAKAFLVPHPMAWQLIDVEEVKFSADLVAHL